MTKRNTQQRRRAIIDLLNASGEVSVEALAVQFATSEVTVRKDLAALEANGLLLRRYGGAVPVPQELIANPAEEKVSVRKQSIAKAAAALIRIAFHLDLDVAVVVQVLGMVVDDGAVLVCHVVVVEFEIHAALLRQRVGRVEIGRQGIGVELGAVGRAGLCCRLGGLRRCRGLGLDRGRLRCGRAGAGAEQGGQNDAGSKFFHC